MDMAKMTGCQPDFRTSLIGGERLATITHTGIMSRKKTHTAGGRYHMSGEQHRTGNICQNLYSSHKIDIGLWIVSLCFVLRRGETVNEKSEILTMTEIIKESRKL